MIKIRDREGSSDSIFFMKKKSISLKAKLTLNKVTLAQLNQQQQTAVAGGGTLSRCETVRTCAPQHTGFASCENIC